MGNKLKKMLESKDNGISFTLNFRNIEDRTDFINIINSIEKTGISQKVPTPQSMEMKKTKGDYQYPYEKIENIKDMWIYPSRGIVVFPIIVDGIQEKYSFARFETNGIVTLKNVKSEVVDVKMELNSKDNTVSFTHTSHPGNAASIDELISEYKRFLALTEFVFQKNAVDEKLEDTKKYFKYSLKAYIRIKELCEVLQIKSTPKMIVDEDDKDFLIEKLYLLLIKKAIIRQNDKLNNIEIVDIDNIEIGKKLFATYCQSAELEIYENHKEIYIVSCIFGAEISNVEIKENGKNTVYFKESEKYPMYRAYSAFLDKESAEKEMSNIMQKREQYENAISLTDQLRELLQ